ncbi:MAG: hypothetical protein KAU14_08680 [Thermoplasmata archaeon]|nr:hypothetical protein [Thermoplasmata archaeon]
MIIEVIGGWLKVIVGLLIVALMSWGVARLLNSILKKKDNSEIVELLMNRIQTLEFEKDDLRGSMQKEKEHQTADKQQIISALKRKGISTDKLIERYNKPLFAILISYASQKKKNEKGKLQKYSFVKEELKRYNSKYLGGTDTLIPPAKVPLWIKNEKDLKKWFEKDILKGRSCKLKFLSLIDLKKGTTWGNYLPYKQRQPAHFAIGEVLNVDDVFTEDQINTISLSQIIRDGDIGWLASSILNEKELEGILKDQTVIEMELGNPSLRNLTKDDMIPKISSVLSDYIENAEEVAKSIVGEARYWESTLKK